MKQNEKGVVFRIAAGYDMVGADDIEFHFQAPSGGTDVVKRNADGVALGSGVTDPVLGALAANTYAEYTTVGTEFDKVGTWYVSLIYEADTGSTELEGDRVSFTVTDSYQVA